MLEEGTTQVMFNMMGYISILSASYFLIGFENSGSPRLPASDESCLNRSQLRLVATIRQATEM